MSILNHSKCMIKTGVAVTGKIIIFNLCDLTIIYKRK